jgi:hypothetical protein
MAPAAAAAGKPTMAVYAADIAIACVSPPPTHAARYRPRIGGTLCGGRERSKFQRHRSWVRVHLHQGPNTSHSAVDVQDEMRLSFS